MCWAGTHVILGEGGQNQKCGYIRQQGHVGFGRNTYVKLNRKSRSILLKLVNRDQAIMHIMKLKQRDRGFMKFLAEVEDQEKLCHMEEGLTEEDLKRMSLLSGLKDRNLVEKEITEEYKLQ